MSFSPGQIIFLISSKTINIVPLLVSEEIKKRKIGLEEEEITYKFLVGDPKLNQVCDVQKLEEQFGKFVVLPGLDLVKEHLVRNFQQNLDNLCRDAHLKAETWYTGLALTPSPSLTLDTVTNQTSNQQELIVDLGNNQTIKV